MFYSGKVGPVCDVAVIGAGVFGSWIACSLLEAGLKVVLIDAYGAATPRSSSGGETRIMRMSYGGDELYARMAARALQLWHQFFKAAGRNDLFYATGVLSLERLGKSTTAQSAAVLEKIGIKYERLSVGDLVQKYAQMCFDHVEGALFEPKAGVLMAHRAVAALVEHHRTKGLNFITSHVAVREGPELCVRFDGESMLLSAGTYVFACGPWLPTLFPELLGSRIRVTRQPVFFFGAPSGNRLYSHYELPAWLDLGNLAVVPDIDGQGVKIMSDEHGDSFNPDLDDRTVSANELTAIRTRTGEMFPGLREAPLLGYRVCQYENTSNGDFIVDRHPRWPNVWLVGGGSGHGFKHGPAIGELVTDLIVRETPVQPRFSLATKLESHRRTVF